MSEPGAAEEGGEGRGRGEDELGRKRENQLRRTHFQLFESLPLCLQHFAAGCGHPGGRRGTCERGRRLVVLRGGGGECGRGEGGRVQLG